MSVYYNESGKVVGSSKRMAETTVKPDHTYTATHEGERGVTTGHWRLSGRWLIYEFTTHEKGRRVVEQHRSKIVKLTDRELVVSGAKGEPGEWTKVR